MTLKLFAPDDEYVPHEMARIQTKKAVFSYWSDGTWKSEQDQYTAGLIRTYHDGSDIPGWSPDRFKLEMERLMRFFSPEDEATYEILVSTTLPHDDSINY